jgi:hypothetical protein
MELPTAPSPGAIVRERYRPDSEIGRAAGGIVYKATDLELEREAAIKILSESSAEARCRRAQ